MSGGAKEDNMEAWALIFIVVLVGLFFVFPYILKFYTEGWRIFRMVEIFPFAYLVPDFIQQRMDVSFLNGYEFLRELKPDEIQHYIDRSQMTTIISEFDNHFVRYFNTIPALIIAYFGIKLYLKDSSVSVKHDMETLLIQMAPNFPHLNQFIGIHPETTSIDFYPEDPESYQFSLAMSETAFASCVPPLGLMEQAKSDPQCRKPIYDPKAKYFSEFLARKSFESQLGNVYQSFNAMSHDEKRLYQSFKDRFLVKQADMMPILLDYAKPIFREIANHRESYIKNKKFRVKRKKLKLKKELLSHRAVVDALWEKIEAEIIKSPKDWVLRDAWLRALIRDDFFKSILKDIYAEEVFEKHAFVYTGLMTMIEQARESETFAPLVLRWLKNESTRTLWYALNCPGKKVAFTESSGTFAHWLLEKEVGLPIPNPEVTEAIDALKHALGINEDSDSSEWS